MNVLVVGAGMMGRAIAFDLCRFSRFKTITVAEKDAQTRTSASRFLKEKNVDLVGLDAEDVPQVKKYFRCVDIVISAVPYRYNYALAKLAVETGVHFIDLGGNNDIVQKERKLSKQARQQEVTVIPDSGLAPGLVSVITHDIVNHMDMVDSVNLRVGGLPRHPQPPLNYQIVFSPYGLINEYVEDAMVLDHGQILSKKSMTAIEQHEFPEPFGTMEAFLTSGGCSTLPYTYKNIIKYLDYKTIRYPGHCEKIAALLDLGLAEETKIRIGGASITPRDVFASLLATHVPSTGEDVVLLKVLSKGCLKGKPLKRDYLLIDYYDTQNHMTAMMRTTGYPVSITAQMIENETIRQRGVFCPEEIIPPEPFFKELRKRGINIMIQEKRG
jgi:lysine 6-dehydrogenase